MGDARRFAELLNGNCALLVLQNVEQRPRPIASVTQLAQVRQGFLGRANHLLQFREFVTEGYEELSVSFPLEGWKCHNAGQVVAICRFFFLGEVSHQMSSLPVDFREDVEQERFDVEVQSFVVEKQLGEETEILTVQFGFLSVDFVNGERVFAIDFLTGRKPHRTFRQQDDI